MRSLLLKREREKKIVGEMISIYCRGKHRMRHTPCPECGVLLDYAHTRSDRCPFMERKSFCSNCKAHCYEAQMRNRIREVMRYAGPRMLRSHPILVILHLIESQKEIKAQDRRPL